MIASETPELEKIAPEITLPSCLKPASCKVSIIAMKPAPEDDAFRDFTSQISGMLRGKIPCASGGFGSVYRCTIESGEGMKEVAVKIFSMAPHAGRDIEKIGKGIRRELMVWLKLRDSTIVPLLGAANDPGLSLFPALVSEWMSSGTLYEYLEKQGTISTSTRVKLAKGVADGLKYLHSNKVVHGDLYPRNVLVDDSGHPRLTDFGLATVAGDAGLQWNSITPDRNFAPRWRAPEVLGIGHAGDTVVRPDFKSDVYSFGSVMFFIVSGVKPWEGYHANRITVALSRQETPTHRDNIGNDHWNLINRCWSWDPAGRPGAKEVTECLTVGITDAPPSNDLIDPALRACEASLPIPSGITFNLAPVMSYKRGAPEPSNGGVPAKRKRKMTEKAVYAARKAQKRKRRGEGAKRAVAVVDSSDENKWDDL